VSELRGVGEKGLRQPQEEWFADCTAGK